MSEEERGQAVSLITATSRMEDLADVDLVIEVCRRPPLHGVSGASLQGVCTCIKVLAWLVQDSLAENATPPQTRPATVLPFAAQIGAPCTTDAAIGDQRKSCPKDGRHHGPQRHPAPRGCNPCIEYQLHLHHKAGRRLSPP